jgi:hypothetical protein
MRKDYPGIAECKNYTRRTRVSTAMNCWMTNFIRKVIGGKDMLHGTEQLPLPAEMN